MSRIVSGQASAEDAGLDLSLRPRRLNEYVGQPGVVANLRVAIEAARSRGDALDHVLLRDEIFSQPDALPETDKMR